MAIQGCPLIDGPENADLLLDYANRKLSPELAEIFEEHLELCPACQEFVASQREVWTALDSFEAMPISDDFDRKLWARIEQEEAAPWWKKSWNWMTAGGREVWRPLAPVAAGLVLAAGLYLRPPVTEPGADTVTISKAAEKVDVEQLETALEDLEMLRELSGGETGNSPARSI